MQKEYQIKVSHKAKRITFRVSLYGDVVVTVPKNISERKLRVIIEKNKSWIDQKKDQILNKKRDLHQYLSQEEISSISDDLPSILYLRALKEEWAVEYQQVEGRSSVSLRENMIDMKIVLKGNVQETEICQQKIVDWLCKRAKLKFKPMMDRISERIYIDYNNLYIKNHKTIWGSCSSKGNINLNKNLLFLPDELVKYIMVHEFCHITHQNHSEKFWDLVWRFLPDYKELDKETKNYAKFMYVPKWAL